MCDVGRHGNLLERNKGETMTHKAIRNRLERHPNDSDILRGNENYDDSICSLCRHVEYHDPVTSKTLCLALHDGGDGTGGECECSVENDGVDRVFVEDEDGSWDEVESEEEAVKDWCERLAAE
jgi:hypothetical protein